jgi:peptide deformylase
MIHRPYVPWPHPVLRTPAQPVAVITDEIRALWDEMIVAMDTMPGVGLAAPQLGVGLALAVVDASTTRGQAVRMANPEILHRSVEFRDHEEGSPNLPGVWARISRPRAVTVRFLNADGAVEDRDFVGLWATSVQHQIDHLAGRMFFDRMTKMRRDMLIKKAHKIVAKTAS